MAVVGLDVDGVLLDIESFWIKEFERITGTIPRKINNQYYFTRRYDISETDALRVWEEFNWSEIPAYDRAVEATETLKGEGHEVILCTCIDEAVRPTRMDSMKRNGFVFDDIVAVGMGNCKTDTYKRLNASIVADDRRSHINHGILAGASTLIHIDRGYHEEPIMDNDRNVIITSCIEDGVHTALGLSVSGPGM